jgi:hypothetical protein
MISLDRRHFNKALAAAVGLSLVSEARADDDTDTGGGGPGGPDTEGDTRDDVDEPEEPSPEPDPWLSNDDPLGLSCRSPGLGGDGMSMIEMLGSGSSPPPGYLGVEAGYYAADDASGNFQSTSDSFLDDALETLKEAGSYLHDQIRDVMEYVFKDSTTSVGTASDPPLGIVAETPVWIIGQTDKSGNESVTVGFGHHVGLFGTYNNGGESEPVSGGAFIGAGGTALMVSIGVSRGDVVVDVGVLVENPLSGASVETSWQFNPTESLREGFQKILGPLMDYRNFQDPLQYPSY